MESLFTLKKKRKTVELVYTGSKVTNSQQFLVSRKERFVLSTLVTAFFANQKRRNNKRVKENPSKKKHF